MRIAHIVPCRNKEAWVAKTVSSIFDQTYPSHIVLSDQGSTDKSLEILRALKNHYQGHHKVSVLQCPITEPKGMRGMNAHLDWLVEQTDEEIIMVTSADDISFPWRTERVVEAFDKHKPDMVLNALDFVEPDGTKVGVTAHPAEDGFVTPQMCLGGSVGGSTGHTFTREFYQAVGRFEGICGFDAFWPFLATCRKGAYFLRESTQAYVRHADPDNTGLEGAYRAADEKGQMQLEELMHFQVMTSYVQAHGVLEKWGYSDQNVVYELYNHILTRAASWSRVRTNMTVQKIPPISLKA